ncbi:MAG: DUF1844 domain-containing protein [Deltaproteobacteria bacterium]|nr:DUF1844 domain-containing protein [Deltaproteobacteria bacterium]
MAVEDKGYKVTDRRAFTPDGELREETAEPAPGPVAEPPEERPEAEPTGPHGPLPEIDFATFLLSLASSAMFQMGAASVEGQPAEVDLPLARQTIDILGMLQQKTKGNLTGEEERLLDHVLYDLRIQFVAATKRK